MVMPETARLLVVSVGVPGVEIAPTVGSIRLGCPDGALQLLSKRGSRAMARPAGSVSVKLPVSAGTSDPELSIVSVMRDTAPCTTASGEKTLVKVGTSAAVTVSTAFASAEAPSEDVAFCVLTV